MIYYSPVDGDVRQEPVQWRHQTAFIMQQLGTPVPRQVLEARRIVDRQFKKIGFTTIDATGHVSGRDFLAKIWKLLLGCPVGVALVHEGIAPSTLANIYYELGILQAYGRETVVVIIGKPALPSDFTRTEWIEAGPGFGDRFAQFLKGLSEREAYYLQMASLIERDPLLAIDYLRRAALLNGDPALAKRARAILDASGVGERTKSSVEQLAISF